MNFIFMGLGPFVVLISLNGLTLRSLIFHLKQQNSSSTAFDDRNKSGNVKKGPVPPIPFPFVKN